MTAPLKYRAWQQKKQRYIPVRNIMFGVSGDPIAIRSGGDDAPWIPISELTLERWTGRVDRNDIPIYENDILQRFKLDYGSYYAVALDVVEWKETATYTGFGLTECGCSKHEVIGNVHEHAELLQGVAA